MTAARTRGPLHEALVSAPSPFRAVAPETAMSATVEAWPIHAGQVWQDKDRRSPFKVRVVRIVDGRVYYQRGGFAHTSGPEHRVHSTKVEAFPRRFRFVSNPGGER